MSHFTVTVRITETRWQRAYQAAKKQHRSHADALESVLTEMFAPYEESPKKGSPYLVFVDETDEWQKEYETGATHDGKKHREQYETFDKFVDDWHGGEKNEQGRYGFTRNPNAKWDWWVIGGRWTGFYPVKDGATISAKWMAGKTAIGERGVFETPPKAIHADIVRVGDIDMAQVNKGLKEDSAKFWAEYQKLLAGEKFQAFEGPRERAMRLGLVRVEQGPYPEPKANERVLPWKGQVASDDDRQNWNDVALVLPEAEFYEKHGDDFNPLLTFAGLDDEGWCERGEMGWFGMSSATPDSSKAFNRSFTDRFITPCGPEDLLVVVDCHI